MKKSQLHDQMLLCYVMLLFLFLIKMGFASDCDVTVWLQRPVSDWEWCANVEDVVQNCSSASSWFYWKWIRKRKLEFSSDLFQAAGLEPAVRFNLSKWKKKQTAWKLIKSKPPSKLRSMVLPAQICPPQHLMTAVPICWGFSTQTFVGRWPSACSGGPPKEISRYHL